MKNKTLSDNTIRKFIDTINVTDFEVETDGGYVDIVAIHETVPYEKYIIRTESGFELECADTHILFDENLNEKYAKDFMKGDKILTRDGVDVILSITRTGEYENMFDLELSDNSEHRYYTNGLLSHNTLLAKKIAEQVFGDENALIRIDMSEYSEKNSVAKLMGTSPGYIGFENGGQLTEAIKHKQHCVLLLDEIEKADQEVYNVFLQLFDEGRMTDGAGQTVNFKNVIIFMTSNIGARKAAEFGHGIGFSTNEESNKKSIIEKEIKRRFNPEFINRINKIIYFNSLTDDNLKNIVKLELNKFNKKLNDINYNIVYNDDVITHIQAEAIKDKEYGARPITRIIENSIEDEITELMLTNDFQKNHTFSASVVDDKISIT